MESLEEIKLRLTSKDPEQRIDALLDAWEYGTAGIELVVRALEDKVRKVRQSALLLLSESETEIAKQALWNYLPFSQMQCLHTITEFKLDYWDWDDEPEADWLYGFAIANFSNSLVICWNLKYEETYVHTFNLATGKLTKNCILSLAHDFGLGNNGKDIVFSFQDTIRTSLISDLENYCLDHSIDIFPASYNAFAVTSKQSLVAISCCNSRTGELEIKDYKTNRCYLHYDFEQILLSTHHINTGNLWQRQTPSLFFTPNDEVLIAHLRPNGLYSDIKLWDVTTGTLLQTFDSLPRLTIISVGVRPDKSIIACGMRRKAPCWKAEDRLCAWELQSDRIIYTASEMSPCILSTDGRVLIYATANYEIVIRDLVADRELVTLQGHDAPIAYLALSEDRQFLASYSIDRQIKIWAIPDYS